MPHKLGPRDRSDQAFRPTEFKLSAKLFKVIGQSWVDRGHWRRRAADVGLPGPRENLHAAGERSGGVDGLADEPGRTDDAAFVAELAEHDRQAAGGEWQRAAVGDAADLGEQGVAET